MQPHNLYISFFNISINFLIQFLTLRSFEIFYFTPGKLGRYDIHVTLHNLFPKNESENNHNLKVHLCRFENLPICSNSCKNNILKISHS